MEAQITQKTNPDRTKAARNAIAKWEPDQTPTRRGIEKVDQALSWIYRWEYSSPTIIDRLCGTSKSGLSARLVRKGLLTETKTESAGAILAVPRKLLTLTELGLCEAERTATRLLPYSTDASRIDHTRLRHQILVQTLTLQTLSTGKITGFKSEFELASRSQTGRKQPDALWHLEGQFNVGVEVELTAKWGRKFDEFIHKTINTLVAPEGGKARFILVYIFSDSAAIVRRYADAFAPGATYFSWTKNSSGHWVRDELMHVPSSIEGKVLCQTMTQ